MTEEWRDIQGYESLYQVSNLGKVRSLERYVKKDSQSVKLIKSRLLKPQRCSNGYLFVCLSKNGIVKQFLIHRLVTNAFLNDAGEVNHIDENKENNSLSNLEILSHSDNIRHGTCLSRRTAHSNFRGVNNPMFGRIGEANPKSIVVVRCDECGNVIDEYANARIAGEKLGINPHSIRRCANGYLKTAGGYKWKNKLTIK